MLISKGLEPSRRADNTLGLGSWSWRNRSERAALSKTWAAAERPRKPRTAEGEPWPMAAGKAPGDYHPPFAQADVSSEERITLGDLGIRDDKHGYQVPFASRIKLEAGIRTGAVGPITEPLQANEIVSHCDATWRSLPANCWATPGLH